MEGRAIAMLTKIAIIFGVGMLVAGILGFVPGITTNEHLLGIFDVNTAHNIVHIFSGAAAISAGLGGTYTSRSFFRAFGVIYALVAVLGLVQGNGLLLGVISNNLADTALHSGIAIFALLFGFGTLFNKSNSEPKTAAPDRVAASFGSRRAK